MKKNPNYNSYLWLLVKGLGEVGCPCIFIIYYDKAKVIGFPAFAVHNFGQWLVNDYQGSLYYFPYKN